MAPALGGGFATYDSNAGMRAVNYLYQHRGRIPAAHGAIFCVNNFTIPTSGIVAGAVAATLTR